MPTYITKALITAAAGAAFSATSYLMQTFLGNNKSAEVGTAPPQDPVTIPSTASKSTPPSKCLSTIIKVTTMALEQAARSEDLTNVLMVWFLLWVATMIYRFIYRHYYTSSPTSSRRRAARATKTERSRSHSRLLKAEHSRLLREAREQSAAKLAAALEEERANTAKAISSLESQHRMAMDALNTKNFEIEEALRNEHKKTVQNLKEQHKFSLELEMLRADSAQDELARHHSSYTQRDTTLLPSKQASDQNNLRRMFAYMPNANNIRAMEDKISRLTTAVAGREAKIAQQKAEIKEKNTIIQERAISIGEQTAVNEQAIFTIGDQKEEVNRLHIRVAVLEAEQKITAQEHLRDRMSDKSLIRELTSSAKRRDDTLAVQHWRIHRLASQRKTLKQSLLDSRTRKAEINMQLVASQAQLARSQAEKADAEASGLREMAAELDEVKKRRKDEELRALECELECDSKEEELLVLRAEVESLRALENSRRANA